MANILVRHPAGRCCATLKNAPCVFLCLFIGKIKITDLSHLVVIQNGFKILLEQRHLAGIFFFMLSIFN